MSRWYYLIIICFILPIFIFGAVSVFDTDATISISENRNLAKMPQFSLESLFNGSFTSSFEKYFSDTFPLREKMLEANRNLNRLYYFTPESSSNDLTLLIPQTGDNVVSGGEALPTDPTESTGVSHQPTTPSDTEPETETTAAPSTEETLPELNTPEDADLHEGSIIIVGNRAMEICYTNQENMSLYATTVSSYAEALPGVRVISLITPNGGEFYSPEEYHSGSMSQKDMIDSVYSQMDDSVVTVDAYSELRKHTDRYIFFRTDHHWTQLGAYYAYTAFCQSTGLEPVPIEDFETGSFEGFVGSMYTYTSKYPQSSILRDNPDTLYYYVPKTESSAVAYPNMEMNESEGYKVSVVATQINSANKYLCFLGGDQPLIKITTGAGTGKKIAVVKESYGNAFVPFLTNHYDEIYVIDPRKFYGDGTPDMDLEKLISENEIDDLLVIDYPLVVSNKSYSKMLANLLKEK